MHACIISDIRLYIFEIRNLMKGMFRSAIGHVIIWDIYSQEHEEYHKNEKWFFSIGKKYEITYEFFLLNYRTDFKNSILSIYWSWWGKKESFCLYTFIFSIYIFSVMFLYTFLVDQCELHAMSGFTTFPKFFGVTL